MKRIFRTLSLILAVTLLLCCMPTDIMASAASTYNWVGAWGTPAIESGIVLGEGENGLHLQDYIPAGTTMRTVITPTISGPKIRLKFSNYFSSKPITINEATVAQTGATDDLIDTKTVTQVTFNGGRKSVTIAAGSEIYSDEITFSVKALKKISISTYYSKTTYMYTIGLYNGLSYMASSLGNRTHQENMTAFASKLTFTSGTITYNTIPFLTRLDVYAKDAYSVVVLGDSTVTNEIPQMLAEKCQKNGITNIGFVMSGIIGNRLFENGTGLLGKIYGEALLDRVNRDAFDVAGVKYVIVKIGINDVLHPMLESNKGKLPMTTAEQVIQGYKDLSKLSEGKGVDMYICTRTPYKGYERAFMGSKDLTWTQAGENILLKINDWVKNKSGEYFKGYIDLDAVRDPKDTAKFRDHMTSDGAHLTRYGQIAVTDLIPEKAYGVKTELKNYSEILNIDPYVAPVTAVTTTKAPVTTTKKPATTTAAPTTQPTTAATTTKIAEENTTAETTTKIEIVAPSEITTNAAVIAPTQATTTAQSANEILLNDQQNNNDVMAGEIVDSGTSSGGTRQIAGFAILAAVAVAIIAIAAVMLIKLSPAPIAKGGKGRAGQRRRV